MDDFNHIVVRALEAHRKKMGITGIELSQRMGLSKHSWAVAKKNGIGSFDLFFRYCEVLNAKPKLVFNKCYDYCK